MADMHPDRERWNQKHSKGERHFSEVNPRLKKHFGLLAKGLACDLAMGAGRNAAWLESQGWRVVGLDLSDVALAKARNAWRVQADIHYLPLKPGRFDLVVCTFFLDRDRFVDIRALLKPGGTVYFETHDAAFRKYRPDFPDAFCLRPGELRSAFGGWTVLHHESGDDGRMTWETLIARAP